MVARMTHAWLSSYMVEIILSLFHGSWNVLTTSQCTFHRCMSECMAVERAIYSADIVDNRGENDSHVCMTFQF